MHAMEQQQHRRRDLLLTPVWLLALRIAQAVLSVLVLGLAAYVARNAYLDELGLAMAMPLVTIPMVAYLVVAEKVPACQPAYHVFVVLALEAFLVVMWLATFAAVAARRARFVVDVTVEGCYNNGGLFSSKSCFVWKLVHFLRARKQGRFAPSAGNDSGAARGHAEVKTEEQQLYQTAVQQPQAHDQCQQPTPAQRTPPQYPYQQQQYPPSPPGAYSPAEGRQHPYGQHPSPQPHPQPAQPMGSELPAQQPEKSHSQRVEELEA